MYGPLLRHVLLPLYETRLRGRATLRRLAELERSEWQSSQQIAEQAMRSMQQALTFAEQHVPYYRRRFAEYGVRAKNVHSPSDLVVFPVLTKSELRAHAAELVAEGVRAPLHASGTGGSTGEPLRFGFDHRTYEHRIAAAMRADGWAGAKLGEPEVHVWGAALGDESAARRMKKLAHEILLRKRMLNAFDLSAARLEVVVDTIARTKPGVVIGYTNPLYAVARFALASGKRLPAPRGVVATAERIFAYQRELIERAFSAPVFDRYGCRELMLIAAECERHEGKHLNAENVFLELYRGSRPALPGETGEVLLTDLVDRSMPLIRYKNDDLAVMSQAACSCGRGLPLLASVEGRVLDMIVGPDGRLLAGEFFPGLLKDHPGIDRYQVYQFEDRSISVRLLPGAGFDPALPTLVEKKLRAILGERARLSVEVVPNIPMTRGGKHRVTVSEVPLELGALP